MYRGITVYRRPTAMRIFVRGTGDTESGALRVASRNPVAPVLRDLQNTAVPLFPPMDLVAFVGLIMSLMAIVFGYDTICGEKQRGTLRLTLSYSVPRHRILLSKWIGGYVTLTVPFLLTLIAAAAFVLLQAKVSLTAGQWTRLGVIVGFAMLYTAAMYSLSICVSCLTRRPEASVLILLTLWVVAVLAVPNLGPHVAGMLRPAAGAQEIESAREATSREIHERLVKRKMEAYDKEHRFDLVGRWSEGIDWRDWTQRKPYLLRWLYKLKCEKEAALENLAATARIDRHYGRHMDAQVALTRWLGRVSPFSCFAMAAAELAGTGAMEHTRYRSQVRDYQRTLCEYAYSEWIPLREEEIASEGERERDWRTHRLKPVPEFHYVPPAAGEYARMVAIDAGILAGVAMVLFMLSYVAFLRYDVR